MKSIKIILTIIVLGVIGFFVFNWSLNNSNNITTTEVSSMITTNSSTITEPETAPISEPLLEEVPDNNPQPKEVNKRSNSAQNSQLKLEEEFWGLINKGEKTKKAYDDLFSKYSNIASSNKVKIFMDKYLSSTDTMKIFNKIPEISREKAGAEKDINKLEQLTLEQLIIEKPKDEKDEKH